MPRLSIFPHARCNDDRCRTSGWMRAQSQAAHLVGDHLPGWDYHTDIRLTQTVMLDLDGIREDCALDRSDSIAALAVWKSSATNLRGTSPKKVLSPLEGEAEADLQIDVKGADAGGKLILATHVIAVDLSGRERGPTAPERGGAILWSGGGQEIRLEGGGGRFPIEPVDFSAVPGLDEKAGWLLDWDTRDLGAPLLGSVRLYLNASHPQVRAAAPGRDDAEAGRRIRQAIYWDVGRQLVHAALDNEEFQADPDRYREGTVGTALARLIIAHFPHDSTANLRQRRSQSPERFEAQLQSAFRIFDDE